MLISETYKLGQNRQINDDSSQGGESFMEKGMDSATGMNNNKLVLSIRDIQNGSA